MKVIFFGSSRQVVPILNTLRLNAELVLVVTTEQGSQSPIPFYCKVNKIDFISVRKSADLIDNLEIMQKMADLGVIADFGLIIPEQTLKQFKFGMINIHPSLLPQYRGATPVQSAILNGDKKTGVSIIQVDKYLDHGPIIATSEEEIRDTDSAKDLYERLFKKAAEMLVDILQKIQSQNIKYQKQDDKNATFTKTLTREDGFMDVKRINNEQELFKRMIRAYYPWPGAWTKAVLKNEDGEKIVKFLPSKKIQVESGSEITYKDFINGYPNADKNLLDFLKNNL
jgi:methionyl-tRNA formyltransferase